MTIEQIKEEIENIENQLFYLAMKDCWDSSDYEDERELIEKKNKLKFFLATTLKIKSIDLLNSNELIDYIYNLQETLLTKEEKSKIHFSFRINNKNRKQYRSEL